jgi:pSer/pThr/pTyr-binding forkhead associated (FHA) protein
MGIDYRIFEGNNTIGRDTKNSICITRDKTISSQHVRILYRGEKFYIKDEMTANGTYLNGEMMEVEKATPLNDGDEIKLGETVFKFKSCI